MPNNTGMEQISAIGRAVQAAGGLTSLARMIGVSVPTVHEWKTFKRQVPAGRCLAIEKATRGAVSRRDLRPDDWQQYWPELDQAPATIAQAATENVAST